VSCSEDVGDGGRRRHRDAHRLDAVDAGEVVVVDDTNVDGVAQGRGDVEDGGCRAHGADA
jgi:hypothetical protein